MKKNDNFEECEFLILIGLMNKIFFFSFKMNKNRKYLFLNNNNNNNYNSSIMTKIGYDMTNYQYQKVGFI